MKRALVYAETTAGEAVVHAAEQLHAAGIDDARLEAEVLLAHAMRIDRTRLLASVGDSIAEDERLVFDALLVRRLSREPLAYVVGHREFYGIELACEPAALIPRPESEMLVEAAVGEIGTRGEGVRVVDVGTGSGAIAIAIAVAAPDVRIAATDASRDALDLARRNARSHGVVGRIELRQGDLLEGTSEFDVIVANLPYVSEAEWRELAPEIREHEPREALVGGDRGTEAIERLLDQATRHLAAGGLLVCEIGACQGAEVAAAAERLFPGCDVMVRPDLAGLDRVLMVRRT